MANKATKRVKMAKSVDHRNKIQASLIIHRLMQHINGEIELSSSQVTSAKTLLSKVLPDLQATQISGDIKTSYVARMPEVNEDADEWQKQHSPTIQ